MRYVTTSPSDEVAAPAQPRGWVRSAEVQLVAALILAFAAARLVHFVRPWVGLVVLLCALVTIRPRLLLLALLLLIAGRAGQELADLEPATLAVMHGSCFTGDCAGALRSLADDYDSRLTAALS